MLSRERFFCSLKKLVFEFNIRDTPMEEQSSDDRQIGEKGDEVRGASAADSQRPEDDNWEGKSDCTSENEADESGSEDGDCDGPSAEENGKGDFERKNGLVPGSRPMKCLETASLTPDEDGLSMGMCNTSGLRDTQRMELKYCAREGHIARRSVLHGEGGKGDDFNSLVLAKLLDSGHTVLIIWKKIDVRGRRTAMEIGQAKELYARAVRAGCERILLDAGQRKWSPSTSLAFVPGCESACMTEQRRIVAFSFDRNMEQLWEEFPDVRPTLYVESHGEKEGLPARARQLDHWFVMKNCSWCSLAIATVILQDIDVPMTVVCTNRVVSLMRGSGGQTRRYCIASDPFLSTCTWRANNVDDEVGYESHIEADPSYIGMKVVKSQVYFGLAHHSWALRCGRANPFNRFRVTGALFLPTVTSSMVIRDSGKRFLNDVADFVELVELLVKQHENFRKDWHASEGDCSFESRIARRGVLRRSLQHHDSTAEKSVVPFRLRGNAGDVHKRVVHVSGAADGRKLFGTFENTV